MRPVVTAAEMAAADRSAVASTTLEQLIARAGAAVARLAKRMLNGAYGRRVIVVAGKGHNGDDGRHAAELLGRAGAEVTVLDAESAPRDLPPADLVIDAAYGTGFRGNYDAPRPFGGTPVLAVDIPSGLHADFGTASETAVRATATITFQALKPGLLLGEGPERAGTVHVADLGIALRGVASYWIDDTDIGELVPLRPRDSHKWKTAVYVCAGSPGMGGAPVLAARGAMRAGAGMVRFGVPGGARRDVPLEVVEASLPREGFDTEVLAEIERFGALVLGPGLGRGDAIDSAVRAIVGGAAIPVVLDADGIIALGSLDEAVTILGRRQSASVLTPHDGEFERLVGSPPGEDRVHAARSLAAATGATVLLKGPTTIVATGDGAVRFVTAGTPALATAGTGDVLSGVIGAFLARGMSPLDAAALGAHVHGRAACRGFVDGLVAGDLPDLIAETLSEARR